MLKNGIMVSLDQLRQAHAASASADLPVEYVCQANLNLYDSPAFERLSTQAVAGRQLRILALPTEPAAASPAAAQPLSENGEANRESDAAPSTATAPPHTELGIQVRLCEDGYPGWVLLEDLDLLDVADAPYTPQPLNTELIEQRLPTVLQYAQQAMQIPNYYLWGGTVGPHYDCSGLVQSAFLAGGIWLPRDAYQQEDATQTIDLAEALPGDLLFFGQAKTTHVGIYLGKGLYIHSSGQAIGRNGIGIDAIFEPERLGLTAAEANAFGETSRAYRNQFRSAGRVVNSYVPAPMAEEGTDAADTILAASQQRFLGGGPLPPVTSSHSASTAATAPEATP